MPLRNKYKSTTTYQLYIVCSWPRLRRVRLSPIYKLFYIRCCLNLWLSLVLCHSPPAYALYTPYRTWLSIGTSGNGPLLNFTSLHVGQHASQTMSYGHINSIWDHIATNLGMVFAIEKRKKGKKWNKIRTILAIACHMAPLRVLFDVG